jgi:hypothetical protein
MKKRTRFLCSLILLPVLIGGASQTFAYDTCKTAGGNDIKWNNPGATYYVNDAGGPSGTLAAVGAGMQTWSDVASSNFVFTLGGTTSSTAHSANDGMNIVTFGPLAAGTVAENAYWFNTITGRMIDSDIRFNTYYSWSTNASSGTMDVQNVGTHEEGHTLCLADLYSGADSQKTMYGYVSYAETKKQTLEQDDIDGVNYLYACPDLAAFIWGTPFEYSLFQDAYDNASNNDTVLSHASVFNENIFIDDVNKTVYLEGGYDCLYSFIVGATTINGAITISDGTLIISDGEFVVQ